LCARVLIVFAVRARVSAWLNAVADDDDDSNASVMRAALKDK
jgi:hypothetical protein